VLLRRLHSPFSLHHLPNFQNGICRGCLATRTSAPTWDLRLLVLPQNEATVYETCIQGRIASCEVDSSESQSSAEPPHGSGPSHLPKQPVEALPLLFSCCPLSKSSPRFAHETLKHLLEKNAPRTAPLIDPPLHSPGAISLSMSISPR
jgi:hypothetical protein